VGGGGGAQWASEAKTEYKEREDGKRRTGRRKGEERK